jgi:predicted MPP superfamily phosphohydrolase
MIRWQDFIVTKARLTRVQLYLPHLPDGLDGLRIFQFGDLHTWGFRAPEKHLYEFLRRESYDLLIVSGDLCYPHSVRLWNAESVTYWNGRIKMIRRTYVAPEVTRALDVCRKLFTDLNPPLGIFAIQGNHDPYYLMQGLSKMGVQVLNNTTCQLQTKHNESFHLCGLRCRNRKLADVPAALVSLEPHRFTIAVSHYPEYAEALAAGGVDLIFCGHTHGGQVCLPNGRALMTHSQIGRKFLTGLERIGSSAVYTTRGMGSSLLPFRVFCPPEVVLLTLYKGDAKRTIIN